MFRKMTLTIVLIASCSWCLALASRAESSSAPPAAITFTPIAPVDSLMHGQGVFFKEIRAQLDNPSSAHRNHEIEEAAEVLAELANVNRHNNAKEDYRAWATELRDACMKLAAEAGKKKDADDAALKIMVRSIKDTCTACHDMYQ